MGYANIATSPSLLSSRSPASDSPLSSAEGVQGTSCRKKKTGVAASEASKRLTDDLGTVIRRVPPPGGKKQGPRQPAYVVSTTGGFRLVTTTRTSHTAADRAVVFTRQELERIRNPVAVADAAAGEAKAAAEAKLAALMARREEEQMVSVCLVASVA